MKFPSLILFLVYESDHCNKKLFFIILSFFSSEIFAEILNFTLLKFIFSFHWPYIILLLKKWTIYKMRSSSSLIIMILLKPINFQHTIQKIDLLNLMLIFIPILFSKTSAGILVKYPRLIDQNLSNKQLILNKHKSTVFFKI